MEGQTVAALIKALKKCQQDKLVLVQDSQGITCGEPEDVLETPENVYIVIYG